MCGKTCTNTAHLWATDCLIVEKPLGNAVSDGHTLMSGAPKDFGG